MVTLEISKVLGAKSDPLIIFKNIPSGSPRGDSSEWGIAFCNSYFMHNSAKVKVEAASYMTSIRKARRASSTYAPGVLPRIIQELSTGFAIWFGVSRALLQGELVHAILRTCPLKKSHDFHQNRLTEFAMAYR